MGSAMNTIRTKLEIIAGIIAAAVIWYVATPPTAPVNEWHPATQSPQVNGVSKEAIKPQQVIVYAPEAKKKLDLPTPIQDDPSKHVIESTIVPSDLHAQTVTTVIDERTGESKTIVRSEPLPWFKPEQHGSLGVGYGITSGLMHGWALNAHEDLLQIKALHFGVDGSVFTGGAYFVGFGMAYRW